MTPAVVMESPGTCKRRRAPGLRMGGGANEVAGYMVGVVVLESWGLPITPVAPECVSRRTGRRVEKEILGVVRIKT